MFLAVTVPIILQGMVATASPPVAFSAQKVLLVSVAVQTTAADSTAYCVHNNNFVVIPPYLSWHRQSMRA